MLVYIVGSKKTNYLNWIDGAIETNNFAEANLVLFTGGEDVCPLLYKETPHPQTKFNINRDIEEMHYFEKCKNMGKTMLGICRGAQFLAVMNGDSLHQHVNNHQEEHDVTLIDGSVYKVSSSHHQMIKCYVGKLIGVSNDIAKIGNNNPEVILYDNCLAIQSHPENMNNSGFHVTMNVILTSLLTKNYKYLENLQYPDHLLKPITANYDMFLKKYYDENNPESSLYKFYYNVLKNDFSCKDNILYYKDSAIKRRPIDEYYEFFLRWENKHMKNPFGSNFLNKKFARVQGFDTEVAQFSTRQW